MKIIKFLYCGNNEKLELGYEDNIYTLIKDNNGTRKKLYSFNFDGVTVFEIDSDNYNRIAVFGNKKVCVFEKGNKKAEVDIKKKICNIQFDIGGNALILYTAEAERFYIDLKENKLYNDDEFYAYTIYGEIECSKNGKFFLGVNTVMGTKEISFINIYEIEKDRKICEFKISSDVCGRRMVISDSGKYVLSAANSKYGVSLIDLQSGDVLWNNNEINGIQYVDFGKNEKTVIVSNDDKKIYFVDIKCGKIVDKINGEKYYINNFGDDVISNGGMAKFGSIEIESSSFGFWDILPIENGIVFAPVNKKVFMCDHNGEIVWESNTEPAYKMKYYNNNVYCICENELIAINAENGKVICSCKIHSGYGSVFIENGAADVWGNIYKYDEKNIYLTDKKMIFLTK